MNPTRRDFLRLGLGGSTLLACGATVPTFLANAAHALAAEPRRPRAASSSSCSSTAATTA